MNIDVRTETFPASGRIDLPNANVFFCIGASALYSFHQVTGGSREQYSNVNVGLKVERMSRWDVCFLTGTAGQTITFVYGIAAIREDVTEFQQQLATINGDVSVIMDPAPLVTDTADVAQASGTQTAIGANLSRRSLLIGCLSSSLNPVRVSKSGGAGRGVEVQPGMTFPWDSTDSLVVRNDNTFGGAGSATWYAEET